MATLTTTGPGTRHEKESLNDYVARIDPAEAPFYSNCSSKTVGAVKHEWTVQELQAVDGSNFKDEGFDSDDSGTKPPDRIDNAVALSERNGKVSGTYDRINVAGGDRESRRQRILEALALRRDGELILTQNNAKVQAGTREIGGAVTYITNVDVGAGGSAPTGDGSDTATPGTDRAFDTIDYVDNAWEESYNDGGNVRAMYMTPGLKRRFSKLPDANAGGSGTSNEINQTNSEPLTFVGAASAYLGDWGRAELIPSRFMVAKTIIGVDPDHAAKGFTPGGEMADSDLGKVGDSTRFQIVNEYTLEFDAPKAHFAVHALDPAL